MSDAEEKQEVMPQDVASLTNRFFQERTKWAQAGKPYRTDERMKEVFEICKGCPFFDGNEEAGSCGICGCRLSPDDKFINKIAWATTNCPHNPPKWEEEKLPEKPKRIKISGGLFSAAKPSENVETELSAKVQEHGAPVNRTIESPREGGCGCGR